MDQLLVRGIECLLALAEELHFGRTATRLGLSQSRVSQLIGSLERRMGAKLVERTSRRVELTRFGAEFVAEVAPAYTKLATVVTDARARAQRGGSREVRIGFQGSVYEEVTEALRRFRADCDVSVVVNEIPMGSPFSAVLDDQVDCAVVQLPVRDPRLTVGFRFPPQERLVAVSSAHPFADRRHVDIEELVALDLVSPVGDAPDYWLEAQVPRVTPSGAELRPTHGVATVQEGLTQVAGGGRAMLLCRPLVERSPRCDVRYVPVTGLTEPSRLALIWRQDRTTPRLEHVARLLAEEFAHDHGTFVAGGPA